MPHYRVYVLDEGGHVAGAVEFDCADDEEASERANELRSGDVELWRRVPLPDCGSPGCEADTEYSAVRRCGSGFRSRGR
jgi:hypothetical protein